MRLGYFNGFVLAATLSVSSTFGILDCAFAEATDANTSAAVSSDSKNSKAETNAIAVGKGSADDFLNAYFAAMHTATGPKDIEPYLATEVRAKMMPGPDDAALGPLFVEMIHSTHPVDVKVVSKKEEGDRVTYELLPTKVPKACEDMANQPSFSMKGSAILVKQDGLWKIHKDYWVAESKGKDGSMRMAFGTDPDKKDKDSRMDDGPGAMPKDYSSTLRDYFLEKWKQEGSGKAIYVAMKISPKGELSEITVGGESPQKVAEDQIREAIMSWQPLPVLPGDQADKPYAWMMFDWKDGGRAISGPYFDDHMPEWVLEKISGKSAPVEKVQ
ncbi:MAG: TonB C-terminal domain-containing protein [Candidatus Melainabacteria bacterium]|nr:TonB C-terminal domain-containing protein [Candidatus Melainabacteria bacterium]